MLEYLKENKQVMMVAVTLFVLSMSSVMFFFGSNGDLSHRDLNTDIVEVTNHQQPAITEPINIKSLQEKEKMYRKLLNNQEDAIFVINIDGTITFTSWNVENDLGYKQNQLNNEMLFLMIHSEDLSTFMGAYSNVIQNKKPVYNIGPYRMRDEAGNYRMHISSIIPILTNNKIEEIIITSKDISNDMNQYKKSGSISHPKTKATATENIQDRSGFID